MCRLFRIQDIGLVRFQPPRPCGGCKAAGSPTKSHGRERYPDPVPTDRTTAVQPLDERRMLVRIQLGGLSCHVTRSVSRADCRSAERGSTPLRGAPPFASRTRPQSGRPSSKRTGWGARPYACTRPCPVDPDRRLLSDATRCNSAAGYLPPFGRNRARQEPSRPRFTAGAVPGLSHPASGSIPAASTSLWKVRSAWCRHRSRKPGGAQAPGFDSCTFRPLEDDLAVARAPFAKRMDLDGLRFDSAGFRASISFSHAPSQRAYTPAGSTGTSFARWP